MAFMASAEHCRDQIAFFSKPYFLGELFPFPFNDNKKAGLAYIHIKFDLAVWLLFLQD